MFAYWNQSVLQTTFKNVTNGFFAYNSLKKRPIQLKFRTLTNLGTPPTPNPIPDRRSENCFGKLAESSPLGILWLTWIGQLVWSQSIHTSGFLEKSIKKHPG